MEYLTVGLIFMDCLNAQSELFSSVAMVGIGWLFYVSASVPDHMVGEIEMEAIQEGRNLSDFRYGCIGYSMYLDDKKSSEGKGDKHPQLPICVGIEVFPT